MIWLGRGLHCQMHAILIETIWQLAASVEKLIHGGFKGKRLLHMFLRVRVGER